ncbi:carbohydrate-binding module family 20 domain-containing protein [Actinoallomurus rhizosphaericola]|uniref:carbohydrate-binding module family 20 domain-containing protein n=1 Tax=Actinoallomurus rhizosphaericola TaxID=2952536 RepID=UPI0020929D07|nr:carbohydrate-binding module family 20 domain-containing protein [Actinoallomurus rhizosphaericola]MCO5998893.1 alpha-amylase family glycosyl hydrolase [Actinoallomurus rhizosphaericola]
MLKRLLPALAVALAATISPVAGAGPATASPTGDHDVIANLFEWNWNSVASECTNVLGPDGYGAVQVAPPEDSLTRSGHPWWEVYQPADYDVNSRMGTRSQFAAMVSACHAAGVKVYADAVINHMTGQGSTSYGGKTFSKYNYPGIYSSADFHNYPSDCPESDDQIHNWNDYTEVTKCELSSLSDLRTESDYVRGKIAGYLNDLLSLGVDGFRVDAAKHIGATDLAAIEGKLTRSAYIYQEVMPGSSGSLAPSAFEGTGDLLEFVYGQKLKDQFNGGIANLQSFGQSWGMEPSNKSVVFVANHDTERNGSTLSYKDGAKYRLATIFSLAWNFGTPQVYSGFDFTGTDDSPPADGNGYVTATTCASGWQGCLDRVLGGMVGWHNAVKGTSVTNWWSDGSNQIAFGRGAKGYVAINNSGSTLSRTFATGLPAGTYCDVIGGGVSSGKCTGTAVTVDGSGNATFSVGPGSAVAIDVAATGTGGGGGGTGVVQVTFNEYATTYYGQNVFVVGSIPALGTWAPGSAVALSSAGYPTWSVTVSLPANTTFQYKYLKKNPDGSVTWESDPNRSYTTGSGGAATINDSWR